MEITIPLVVVMGALVFVACRYLGMRWWHAIAAAVFGFLMAATTLAPDVGRVLIAVVRWATRL